MSPTPLNPPIVVLVRPQAYGNIGAMARSMANFGFSEIRVVGDVPKPENDHRIGNEISQSDWALATPRGHAILKGLKIYASLEDAIGDCHLILGTSGKKDAYHGGFQRKVVDPETAFTEAKTFAQNFDGEQTLRSALVFGPEDDGLSSPEAAHCDILIHIPTHSQAPSMNLAMAATLIFYTFHCFEQKAAHMPNFEKGERIRKAERNGIASFKEMESLVRFVLETLSQTQFFKMPDEESTKARLRRVLRSWQLNQGDLLFVFEIFYQLKCWGQGAFEGRDFLSK